ncbi:hypothetical protein DOTSEDRAFT_75722 [Dothistroma septosporum NZE10]|uniref:Uncharacterized protein n=1 Tax=Dothistroma septosporum (strain NZE10 / CBS 128990) TaxID=675120 RepID=N1PDH4_DOTSN|nr:hypothetical protein DOTSEDRAFT_75722 [Dothistroma septosporum NZE10]
MANPIHSTGRGGAGNIGPDGHVYVDGDIIREGTPGVSKEPDYSAGRGGAGNIAHADRVGVPSHEVVPESATRTDQQAGANYDNYHTGRGGEGNVHKEKYGGHSQPQKEHGKESLLDKAKHAVGLDKKEKTPEPSTK